MDNAKFQEIRLEKDPETGVAVLVLNRPQYHNALNGAIRMELLEAAEDVAEDDAMGALVLIGAGERAFSVGADLRDPTTDHSVSDFTKYISGRRRRQRWYDLLCHYPKGIISAVNGYVAGSGLQLALTGDILIGTPSAQFWIPQVALGLAPHVGTLVKLARIMGQQRMLSMILTGRRLSSQEAEAWGLLSEIVPLGDLRSRAVAIAAKVAAQPRLSIQMTKESYFRAIDMPWGQAMDIDELKSFGMFQTSDRRDRHQQKKAELGIKPSPRPASGPGAAVPAAEQAD